MELKKKHTQQYSYGNDKGKDIDSSEHKAVNRGARLSQEVVSLPSMWYMHCLEGYCQDHGDSSIGRVIKLEKPQTILKTELCDFNPGFSRG